jgi:type II secretory pathway component PulK
MKFKDFKSFCQSNTYWGFPVEAPSAFQNPSAKARGIAIIIAILAVSMIMIFSGNMIINSQVNLEMAVSSRDNLKAEYMAKSGFNLAIFMVSADFGFDLAQYTLDASKEPTDGSGDMWSTINGLPIGGDTVEMLAAASESFDLNAVNDDKVIDQLKLFDGQFVVEIEDEASRINVNSCVDGQCSQVKGMLQALMSCPVEKLFLERKNISAKELTYRIFDWVDKNSTAEAESGFNDENDAYLKKVPPYSAKNVPFDTIDELKLIEGWDDEVHAIFSPYITIFPFRKTTTAGGDIKVNINSVCQNRELFACLFPDTSGDCKAKSMLALQKLCEDPTNLSKAEVAKFLEDTYCYNKAADLDAAGGAQDKGTWLTNRSDVYRVKATGQVGKQQKNLMAIIERRAPDNSKKESAYKILYWRMQ